VHTKAPAGKEIKDVHGALSQAETEANATPDIHKGKMKRKKSTRVKEDGSKIKETYVQPERPAPEKTGAVAQVKAVSKELSTAEKQAQLMKASETKRKAAEAILEKRALIAVGNNEGTKGDTFGAGEIVGMNAERRGSIKGDFEARAAEISATKEKRASIIGDAATDGKHQGAKKKTVHLDKKLINTRANEMSKEQQEYDDFVSKRLTQAKEIRDTRQAYEEAQQAQIEEAAKNLRVQQEKEAAEAAKAMAELQLQEQKQQEAATKAAEIERLNAARKHQASMNTDHGLPWLRGAHQ